MVLSPSSSPMLCATGSCWFFPRKGNLLLFFSLMLSSAVACQGMYTISGFQCLPLQQAGLCLPFQGSFQSPCILASASACSDWLPLLGKPSFLAPELILLIAVASVLTKAVIPRQALARGVFLELLELCCSFGSAKGGQTFLFLASVW